MTPLEELKRTTIEMPSNLHREPEAAALILLLKALTGRLRGDQIVLLVAASLPISFFSEAGRLLNREVQLLGPARAGTTWKDRWSNEVSGEVLELLYLMPPRKLAVVEKGEGPHRQSGDVHYRHLAGYGGGESSSRHVHTPAKDVLAWNADNGRSLEDDLEEEGAAPKTPVKASSSAAVPAPDAWTGSESAINEVSDAHVKELLDALTNMTTSVKRVRNVNGDLSSFHPDCFLEQAFIRESKNAMGNLHKSQVFDRGAELNATVGSTTGLEANVGKAAVDPVREHRARLKRPRENVLMMRAAIRKFIIPGIRRQLEERRREQQEEQAQEPMQEEHCSEMVLPRIPTRAEEQRVETRACNPDFIKTPELAISRVIEMAQWRLREELGGLYNVPNAVKNYTVVSFFRKILGQALADLKKKSARAYAVVSYLSGNPAAAAAINSTACLDKCQRRPREA